MKRNCRWLTRSMRIPQACCKHCEKAEALLEALYAVEALRYAFLLNSYPLLITAIR